MSGKAVIAMPATEVAIRDARPERNSPRTPRDRVRMMINKMRGGAVRPLKMAARYRARIGFTPMPTNASPIAIEAMITA